MTTEHSSKLNLFDLERKVKQLDRVVTQQSEKIQELTETLAETIDALRLEQESHARSVKSLLSDIHQLRTGKDCSKKSKEDTSVDEKDELIMTTLSEDIVFKHEHLNDESLMSWDPSCQERKTHAISEDGKSVTHIESGYFFNTYRQARLSQVFAQDIDHCRPLSSCSVTFKIDKSEMMDVYLGLISVSETRTQGFFGWPLNRIGLCPGTGALAYPFQKCNAAFCEPCKVGDIIELKLILDSEERASLEFSKEGDMLGSLIHLDLMMPDWHKGVQIAVITRDSGDIVSMI